MKIVIRILLVIIGTVLLGAVLLGVLISMFFDPNDYREEIAAAVTAQTGRELVIDGDLELGVAPCCSVQIGRAALGNPVGFEEANLLQVDEVAVSLKLIPLIFRQQIEMGQISFDGLQVNLQVHDDGADNWTFETDSDDAAKAEPEADALTNFSVDGLNVSNAVIVYNDAQSDTQIRLESVQLKTGPIVPGESFNLSAALRAVGVAPDTTIELKVDALVSPSEALDAVRLSDVKVHAGVVSTDLPTGQAEFEIALSEVTAGSTGAIVLSGLTLDTTLAGLAVNVKGRGEIAPDGSADLAGSLSVAPFAPREVMAALETEPPLTADPSALSSASFASEWFYKGRSSRPAQDRPVP